MLIVQGILSPEDARKAVDSGVDGIVVSNHGGRQLDYSPATLDMILPIRNAIGHRVPLLMDGGIRRGTDILKARPPAPHFFYLTSTCACNCTHMLRDVDAAMADIL